MACAVAAVTLLVVSSENADNVAFLFHSAMVLVAVCGLICPLASSVGTATLLQIAAVHPELQSPVVIFSVLTTVALVSVMKPPLTSALLAVVLWYLTLTGFAVGDFFPEDPETATILGALLVAVWAGALLLRDSLIRRRRQSEQFEKRLEEERDRTVRALHGSVAASLTSVVLRSESMAMNATDGSREESLLIAEDARRAMSEVRELIRFMRSDTDTKFESSSMRQPFTLYENLSTIIGKLRSHGLTVIDSGVNEATLGNIQLEHGYTVFRELKTNILKYADRHHPVIVAAVHEDDALTVAIQNTIAGSTPDFHMTTEIGLKEAADLVRGDGGSLVFTTDGPTWRSELRFPLEQSQ